MAQLMENVGYLSKEIGPRPAGTEEEQQAALYITEQFQKETGFTANIEEFTTATDYATSRAVLALVIIAVTLLAIVFPVLNIPAFLLACAAAVVYVLESFDRPVLARLLSRGASQNVVAKYQPAFDGASGSAGGRSRGRKIVLVAHYDTARVTPRLVARAESSGLPLPLICLVAIVVAAFFQLLRVFMAPGGGMGLLVLNLLSIIALVVCALPVVKLVLDRRSAYNEGANNNATGTAALIEVARRIARGSVSEADLANEADDSLYIHGEAAAREAGLVPEGAQIRYEAEQLVPPSELGDYDEEERLLAAKAAIAAMTGKPVDRRVFGSVADKLVNPRVAEADVEFVDPDYPHGGVAEEATELAPDNLQSIEQVAPAEVEALPEARESAEGFENAPSWFIAAQKNARKGASSVHSSEVQRSKYTEAIENAERGRAEREQEAREAEWAEREAQQRLHEEEARAALDDQAAAELADARESDSDDQVAGQSHQAGAVAGASAQDDAQSEARPKGQLAREKVTAHDQSAIPRAEEAPSASPHSTIAMAAPVPAAEIAAEAALLDADPNASADRQAAVDSVPQSPARERIAGLPAIDPSAPAESAVAAPAPTQSPSKSGILRKLRTNIPSLSGLIDPVPGPESAGANRTMRNSAAADANRERARRAAVESVPSVVNAPTPAEASRVQAHPSSAAIQAEAPAQLRRKPSVSASGSAAAPAQAGPAADAARDGAPIAMDVPRSRSANLLNRLHRDNDDALSETPQEWLDVDKDFDARTVGRERGGWESFRDEQYFEDEVEDFGTDDRSSKRRRWQGGAYSRMSLGHVNMRSGADTEADVMIPEELPEGEVDHSLTGEIEQIYHFRNPLFNTEVWFVAIGSDTDGHDGVRAFLDEHRDDLRGSMIIEVESLGAGTLSVATEEGRVRKLTASSRVKRYTRAAVASTGLALDEVSLAGTDSIASTAQKAGFQTMHLFGAEDGRPALKGSADDVLENVDELVLDDNVNFIFELLKQ